MGFVVKIVFLQIFNFLIASLISAIAACLTVVLLNPFAYCLTSQNPSIVTALSSLAGMLMFVYFIIPLGLPLALPIAILGGLLVVTCQKLRLPMPAVFSLAAIYGCVMGSLMGIALSGGWKEWPGNWPYAVANAVAGVAGAYTFLWARDGGMKRLWN